MATRFIDKNSSPDTTNTPNLPDAAGICVDDGVLVYNNGSAIVPVNSSGAPVAVTATTLTVTAASHAGRTVLLSNVAGCAVDLPAATGTGNKYRFFRSAALTSGSDVITALAGDLMAGYALVEDGGDTTPSDVTLFPAIAASTVIYTDAFTGGGGDIGNWFEAEDVATDRWMVKGYQASVLDPVTPFS